MVTGHTVIFVNVFGAKIVTATLIMTSRKKSYSNSRLREPQCRMRC